MSALFRNGRFRAALSSVIVALISHFVGQDVDQAAVKNILDILSMLLLGAAIPSELFGDKNK